MSRNSTDTIARAAFFMKHKNTFQKKSVRMTFHTIGCIILLVGIMLIASGTAEREAAQNIDTTETEQPIWGDREVTDMDKLREKNEKEFNGFTMIAFGLFLCFGAVMLNTFPYMPRFYASYYGPVIHEMGDAIGEGISKAGGSRSQEVIRIKCRECGYLETEDAEFCSKCGQKI